MSYKIKSLIYLICFVASSALYYNMEQEFNPLSGTDAKEIVKTEVSKVDTDKTPIENRVDAAEVQ